MAFEVVSKLYDGSDLREWYQIDGQYKTRGRYRGYNFDEYKKAIIGELDDYVVENARPYDGMGGWDFLLQILEETDSSPIDPDGLSIAVTDYYDLFEGFLEAVRYDEEEEM